jgi:hypothetical protein
LPETLQLVKKKKVTFAKYTVINTQFLFGTRLFPTHVFVLETDNGLVLFDTGGPGSGPLIVGSMKTAGYDPGAPSR